MIHERWLTIPNSITFARLALIPVFVALHLLGRPGWALLTFVIAGLSDGIDGLLARLLDQRSKLGGILDPIADKLLVLSAYVTLTIEQRLPIWLLALILFRDGWMVIGFIMVRMKNLDVPTQPSRIGKYATFSLVVLVVLALWDQSTTNDVLHAYTAVWGFIAAQCVVISTLQYFARYGYLFFVPGRPPPTEG